MKLAPSDKAQQWLKNAGLLWRAYKTVEFDAQDALQLDFVVRYPNYHRDFVGALDAIADALQHAGVVKNDRQIRALGPNCHAMDVTGEPCTWVRIEKIGELPWEVQKS